MTVFAWVALAASLVIVAVVIWIVVWIIPHPTTLQRPAPPPHVSAEPHISAVAEPPPITIALKPEDVPTFKRVYTVTVGDGFVVEVTMLDRYYSFAKPQLERRDYFGCLTQKNRKYILFDVHAVADKIIDRDLYPLVQAQVDRILALDAAFVKERPTEFIDESGQRWKRVP